MRIGILTYYNVHNHGALLQAKAMQNYFQSKNVDDVEFLRFERNYDYISEHSQKKYRLSIRSVPFLIKYFFDNGIGTFLYNAFKRSSLDKFRKNELNIGRRYTDNSYDSVCIGSDEVFALDVGINPFFYGHCIKSKKIFSYAGCFGQTTYQDVKDLNCEQLIKSGFEILNAIGVRDKNSYDIASAFAQDKTVLVCDPVLLYGFSKEIKENIPREKNKYILIYSYDKNMNDENEVDALRKFARKHNYKIYSVGYYHKWCDKNINVDPYELLGYFKNAEYIITDTFHGSVISIITESNFFVKLRTNRNKLAFLLEEYDLTNRIVSNFTQLDEISNIKIDYKEINAILEKKRLKSMKFLELCLYGEKK